MNKQKIENIKLLERIYTDIIESKLSLNEIKIKYYQRLEDSEQIFFKHLYEVDCENGKYTLEGFRSSVEKDGLAYYCVHYYGFENISIQHIMQIISHYNLMEYENECRIIKEHDKYYLIEYDKCGNIIHKWYRLHKV